MIRKLLTGILNSRQAPELFAATIVINILGLGSSLYSIHLLNRYVSIGLTATLVTLTVGVMIAIGFELVLRKQRQKVLMKMSKEQDAAASDRVFKAFTLSRYDALSAVPIAVRREALGAPLVMQQLASTNNMGSLLDLPFVLFYLLVATLLYWPFGVFGLLAALWALYRGVMSERKQRRSAEEHSKSNARAQQLGQFLLAAGESIRCLPLIGPLSKRWEDVQGGSMSTRRDGMAIQTDLQSSIQTVGQLLTVSVYAFGAAAAVHGDLTTGALIGGNILVARAFAIASRAAYLADPMLRAGRADEALKQVAATEVESRDGATPAMLKGRIEVFDGAFAYAEQPVPLFEKLNLEVQSGQVVVITGANGAGKSTLIKVMLGLLTPQRGTVRADGIELRQLSQDWWRARIGYVPQEPSFFDGTLRENLLLDRGFDDSALLSLIQEMGLEDFLAHDPAGLDRAMNSHDSSMAVGLRRRFAIIRAILGDPRILFMDDPTEGLDQAGQLAVAKLLNRLLTEGRTLVVVSNEPFILRAADWVVEMDKKPVPGVVRRTPEKNEPSKQ